MCIRDRSSYGPPAPAEGGGNLTVVGAALALGDDIFTTTGPLGLLDAEAAARGLGLLRVPLPGCGAGMLTTVAVDFGRLPDEDLLI